jgi:hypothetical protein
MRPADVAVCDRPYRAVVAESFIDALLGLHAVSPGVEAVVIHGNSVHGLTLRRPIWVVGVNHIGDGAGGRLLRPGRIVRFPGAEAVIEFPRGLACDGEHRTHAIRWSGRP